MVKGSKHSENTRIKMSEVRKKQVPPNLGNKHTEETRKKMSDIRLGNIRCKHTEKTKQKIREANLGENNPNWLGGITPLPYSVDWTRTLRRSIRERDHYVCRMCGKLQSDRAFAVHHIDYDKLNCSPDNLITLCIKCHAKTNTNRKYWINYFS